MTYRSKWGWYFAPDEGAGGGSQETEEEPTQETEEAEEPTEESTEEETKEETSESEESEGSEEEKEPQVRDLTDEEIAERAKALGFVKPEKPEEKSEEKGLEIRDYRGEAYQAVVNASNAKANGWVDEDGDITYAGQQAAENYAVQLAADSRMQAAETEREKLEIQANRSQYTEANVKFLRENEHFQLEEGLAAAVGKTMTDILVDSYGPVALKPKNEQEAEIAKKLWSTSYYMALGIETHNARVKAQEGGDKGDAAPPEKPKGGGGESVLAGLDKSDREWIEKEYLPRLKASKGGDYKPTKADIERAKELISR